MTIQTNPEQTDWDNRCRDCDDTGVTIQTERRCACQPPLPQTNPTPPDITKTNAIIAIITDAINDSLGPDWDAFEAAHHVFQWLHDEGLQIVPVPKRGTTKTGL